MSFPHTRRDFIIKTAKASLAAGTASIIGTTFLEACTTTKKNNAGTNAFNTPFTQQALPYAYQALEPFIDAKTMEIHYTKHAAAYATNLEAALIAESVNRNEGLEKLLGNISKYSDKMRNNAGGHYNHELFWKTMKPNGEGKPGGSLLSAIESKFRSFADFKAAFNEAAKSRFGSGWAWLVLTEDKNLLITSTANQDNPLMNVANTKGFPLLGLDVWEHAYYLKYQNKRADYIDAWWNVVNWAYVQQRYEKTIL